MARTAIPVVVGSDVGQVVAGTVPNVQGIIPPDAVLLIVNLTGGTVTVTVQTPVGGGGAPSGLDLPDRVVTISNGLVATIGPFSEAFFGRPGPPDQGQVYVDFSPTIANLVCVCVQVPRR
jgi:hypothetical protein